MRKEFKFNDKALALEMGTSAEADGEFQKCQGNVYVDGQISKGTFKLTKAAWEAVKRKSDESQRPIDEILVVGCIGVLKAELYIRSIPDGFAYVVDYRFFDKPPGY